MGSHEHDLTQMEHEIRDLLAKLETKDILIQEHKDAFKSLEQVSVQSSHFAISKLSFFAHFDEASFTVSDASIRCFVCE